MKNHVITGVSGDDLDIPGYIESHDPETGDAAMALVRASGSRATPEAKTWPSVEAMMHGGGMTWVPSTYDPELNLMYFRTGNPQPVIAGQGRAGRQSLHRVHHRAESRHGKDGVVFPAVAARHARLGRGADAGAVRRRDQRAAAQAAGAGQPQRMVLRARPRHRQEHREHANS